MEGVVSADLLAFIEKVSIKDRSRVESELGHGLVRLCAAEAEKRQAKQDIRSVEEAVVELLRNARDAGAREIYVATARSGDERRVTVIDDGSGLSPDAFESIFEPRVTSKLDSYRFDDWGIHGRGMALYSIRENAKHASVVASCEGGGSAFRVLFDMTRIEERRDQSTKPFLTATDSGLLEVGSGPHNIARSVAEFALAGENECTVYFGTPAEMVSALLARSARVSVADVSSPFDSSPVCDRLISCSDASQVVACAEAIGLDISLRSAYRVLSGSPSPPPPFLSTLKVRGRRVRKRHASEVDLERDYRGLKVAEADMAEFESALKAAWAVLADSYFLEADVRPDVRISCDGVSVTFPVQKQL